MTSTLGEVLRRSSRTFAIGIERLQEPLRSEMRVAYLALRVADYFEDNTSLDPGAKGLLLRDWAAALTGGELSSSITQHLQMSQDSSPDLIAAKHAPDVLKALEELSAPAQDVIRRHTHESALGMARWIRVGPVFEGEPELDDYMHEVAGRVGYLITDLFGLSYPSVREKAELLRPLAREFGLGLQTVNVIRGLPGDIRRGWFFIPEEFLTHPVSTPEKFLDPVNQRDALMVVDRLIAKAERHLSSAREYILHLPRFQGRMRFFCLLPYLFALGTLRLSRRNPLLLTDEVKLSRPAVLQITRRSILLGWSDSWIARYSKELGGE